MVDRRTRSCAGPRSANPGETQDKENQELAKISQQIKPKEETMAIVQNAVNLVDQQIQSRDETITIQKEENKTNKK